MNEYKLIRARTELPMKLKEAESEGWIIVKESLVVSNNVDYSILAYRELVV